MKRKGSDIPSLFDDLRRRAEARLHLEGIDPKGPTGKEPTAEELRRALHELRTHQIEIEMQNEELREAQDALVKARDRATDLFEFAPMGYVTLSAEGLVVEANMTLVDLLDTERRRLLRQPLSAWVVPADHDVYYRHLRDLTETRRRQICEVRLRKAAAADLWVKLESVVLEREHEDGAVMRMALSDITALKREQDERRELEVRLRRAEKLESLGVMAGGIAHDFNNLIQAILSRAELMLFDLPRDSAWREPTEAIARVASRAGDLALQMLLYAGKGTFALEPLDLSTLVGDLREELAGLKNPGITLSFTLLPGLPTVMADATRMRQVVTNLVINAAEAIGETAGMIDVSVFLRNCDEKFLREAHGARELPAGDYVYLEVADNGRGLDAPTRERVFEPFFSTKFAGRGLGMASLLGIVHAHRGGVRLRSEPGRGTTFQVLLPVQA